MNDSTSWFDTSERSTRAGVLKRGILLFWMLWIGIVSLLNIGNVLKVTGVLPETWKLSSGNYQAIVDVTSRYGTPHWIDMLLILGVIVWEVLAATLFWWAFRRYRPGRRAWHAINLAFSTLLGLFGAFILSDEIFHAYGMEGDHRGIAILLLASLLAFYLLPDRAPAGK